MSATQSLLTVATVKSLFTRSGALSDRCALTRRLRALAARNATNAHLTHQTRHTLLTYKDTHIHQVFPDARGTIGAI